MIKGIVCLCRIIEILIVPLDVVILYPRQKLSKLWVIHWAEHLQPKVLLHFFWCYKPLINICRIFWFHRHILILCFYHPRVSPDKFSQIFHHWYIGLEISQDIIWVAVSFAALPLAISGIGMVVVIILLVWIDHLISLPLVYYLSTYFITYCIFLAKFTA